MRLNKAIVQKYRSIRGKVEIEVESDKTIFVGPNEAGKSALLQAIQQLNPPKGVKGFQALRDYPRAEYNDISRKIVDPSNLTIVEGHFTLDDDDRSKIPKSYSDCVYVFGRKLDNSCWHNLQNAPELPKYKDLKADLTRLVKHLDGQPETPESKPSESLGKITIDWRDSTEINLETGVALKAWLESVFCHVEEGNTKEEERHQRLLEFCEKGEESKSVLETLHSRLPVFVLFTNYFRVRPLLHLDHLASRLKSGVLDDDQYDYGNSCLLKLLGFTARELSNLGKVSDPSPSNKEEMINFREQLDNRSYQLNAASVKLTNEIRRVWLPDLDRGEADKLRINADGQYLKVVVEDDLGVEVELDQRSEGFQWLTSFFVVFFAESEGKHKNAILLLDEPGMSLHGLKQRDFRETITRLSQTNQTIYTTHSPFLVGPDELDKVRVVEMPDRKAGTAVHNQVTSSDPGALLPLQEALGYDLAQSLFSQQRNLILEGLTDYWYVEALSELFKSNKKASLEENIALIPAQSAGKVVYFATILHAHKLKVAALLDSDAAGDQAAKQDVLVHKLGNKAILRTKDFLAAEVANSEVEDLLRSTLTAIAKAELGWDVSSIVNKQPKRSIVSIFEQHVKDFSKYKLAKTFLKWTRSHDISELDPDESANWERLFAHVNKVLK